jgi:NADH:ubiquinone oxidoreductase subunit 5 (subunit L)/multisubunit Na+/H+ antiporter MnhA subunit
VALEVQTGAKYGLTMFMAGLGASFEYDLKRIIALSTLRQLLIDQVTTLLQLINIIIIIFLI